jgi:hypothetical protein
MVANIKGFIGELQKSGANVMLTEAFRTTAGQAKVEGNKYGGAAPGQSLHEAGYAIDINWKKLTPAQQRLAVEIAPKYGFQWGGNLKMKSSQKEPDRLHFYMDPFSSMAERREAIRSIQEEFARK